MKKHYIWSILLLCLLLSGCSSSQKVDLMSFATIEFTGLDSKGKAVLTVNWGDFENAVLSEKDQESITSLNKVIELEDSIKYSVNQTERLSNGDEVILSVEWDKEIAKKYNLKFTATDKKITVSDLLTATEIDLFQEISIEYSGVAPSATAILRNASSDPFLKTVNYTIDNPSSLSNGDKITVTATYNETTAESSGYLVTNTKKTYTVEGIDEYITAYSMIDEDTFAKMDQQSRDVIESTLADKYSFASYLYPDDFTASWSTSFDSVAMSGIELKNAYFFVLKKGMDKGFGDVNNSIFLIYEVHFRTNISQDAEDVVYLPVYYKDIVLRDSGTIDVVITGAAIPSSKSNNFDNLYRDIVTANKAKYVYEEIEY